MDDLDQLSVLDTALALLGEVYNKTMTPLLIRAYDLALRDIPDGAIARGCDWLLQHHSSSFMPTPAELYRACRAVMTPEETSLIDGVSLLKSWLTQGVKPAGWSPDQFTAVRAALHLPPPTADDLAYLTSLRDAHGTDTDWPTIDALPPGPVVAHILGRHRATLAGGTTPVLLEGATTR